MFHAHPQALIDRILYVVEPAIVAPGREAHLHARARQTAKSSLNGFTKLNAETR